MRDDLIKDILVEEKDFNSDFIRTNRYRDTLNDTVRYLNITIRDDDYLKVRLGIDTYTDYLSKNPELVRFRTFMSLFNLLNKNVYEVNRVISMYSNYFNNQEDTITGTKYEKFITLEDTQGDFTKLVSTGLTYCVQYLASKRDIINKHSVDHIDKQSSIRTINNQLTKIIRGCIRYKEILKMNESGLHGSRCYVDFKKLSEIDSNVLDSIVAVLRHNGFTDLWTDILNLDCYLVCNLYPNFWEDYNIEYKDALSNNNFDTNMFYMLIEKLGYSYMVDKEHFNTIGRIILSLPYPKKLIGRIPYADEEYLDNPDFIKFTAYARAYKTLWDIAIRSKSLSFLENANDNEMQIFKDSTNWEMLVGIKTDKYSDFDYKVDLKYISERNNITCINSSNSKIAGYKFITFGMDSKLEFKGFYNEFVQATGDFAFLAEDKYFGGNKLDGDRMSVFNPLEEDGFIIKDSKISDDMFSSGNVDLSDDLFRDNQELVEETARGNVNLFSEDYELSDLNEVLSDASDSIIISTIVSLSIPYFNTRKENTQLLRGLFNNMSNEGKIKLMNFLKE